MELETNWATPLRFLMRGMPVLLFLSLLVHGALFSALVYFPYETANTSWLFIFFLVAYPVRASFFNGVLHNVSKGDAALSRPFQFCSLPGLVSHFLNNFLWCGYSLVTMIVLSSFLPQPPVGIHLALIALAATCIPAAYVDCYSTFEARSFGSAFKASWRLAYEQPIGVALAYLLFWEGVNHLPQHVDRIITPIIGDERQAAVAILTISVAPLYALLWTYIFATWKSFDREHADSMSSASTPDEPGGREGE